MSWQVFLLCCKFLIEGLILGFLVGRAYEKSKKEKDSE